MLDDPAGGQGDAEELAESAGQTRGGLLVRLAAHLVQEQLEARAPDERGDGVPRGRVDAPQAGHEVAEGESGRVQPGALQTLLDGRHGFSGEGAYQAPAQVAFGEQVDRLEGRSEERRVGKEGRWV